MEEQIRTSSQHSGYQAIVDALAERIAAGAYPPGGRLPSGSELCEEFGVSPVTVSRAFSALKSRGLVSTVRGRGTFARSADISDSSFKLSSLSGAWLDESAEIRLLFVKMARADSEIAGKLGITVGRRAVHLRRVVSVHGRPSMIHTEYVIYDPLQPLLESQLHLTSLHAFLDPERGQRFPQGELTVRAANLGEQEAAILEEAPGTAVLCLEHLFRDSEGTPVSLGWFLLRNEQFELRARLQTHEG